MVATAAYGSEMAPEVFYMRHVRDGMIGSNQAGRALVNGWNGFYYSWSPPIAKLISSQSVLQPIFRILLLPLVGIVHMTAFIYTISAYLSSTFASLVAFIFATILSTAIYLAIPIITSYYFYRKRIQ